MKTKEQLLLEEAYDQTKINIVIEDYIKNGCLGDLDLMTSTFRTLPSNLQYVGGNLLLLSCTNLKTLPDNLTVKGNVDLRFCWRLKALPNNLTVGGTLLLQDCDGLTTLPAQLKIEGDLRMTSTNIQLKDIKHHVDIKGEVCSDNFTQKEFEDHNRYGRLREKLPELEGII